MRVNLADDQVETVDTDTESEKNISDKDESIAVKSSGHKIGKEGEIRWRKHLTELPGVKGTLVRKKSFGDLDFIFL